MCAGGLLEYNSFASCLFERRKIAVCVLLYYKEEDMTRDKNEFKMWKNTSKNKCKSTINKILSPCTFFVFLFYGWDLFVHESSKSFIEN